MTIYSSVVVTVRCFIFISFLFLDFCRQIMINTTRQNAPRITLSVVSTEFLNTVVMSLDAHAMCSAEKKILKVSDTNYERDNPL